MRNRPCRSKMEEKKIPLPISNQSTSFNKATPANIPVSVGYRRGRGTGLSPLVGERPEASHRLPDWILSCSTNSQPMAWHCPPPLTRPCGVTALCSW